MIGAHKLELDDVIKIRELLAQGYSQSHIARIFVSRSGHKVSREHINQIANGRRWNLKNHSFVMKENLDELVLNELENLGYVENINESKIENNFYLFKVLEENQRHLFNNELTHTFKVNPEDALALNQKVQYFFLNNSGGVNIFIQVD